MTSLSAAKPSPDLLKRSRSVTTLALLASIVSIMPPMRAAIAQVAIKGKTVHTMAGDPISNGVVVIRDGKIADVGPASRVSIPSGFTVIEGNVVTPGLIDAHSVVGLSGYLNYKHDQEQIEHSSAIQPELRAIDAYNPLDPLVDWVRGFGITTVHTGHAPGELISGQTCLVKTTGTTVEEAVIVPTVAIAATLSPQARKGGQGKSPGTRAKMMSMLREELIKAVEYKDKLANAKEDKKPDRNLRLEALVRVVDRELPLMVTANRVQDIDSVMRLADEFNIRIWLDGAAESYKLIDEIKAAGFPVLVHPTMQRAVGETENLSFETAAHLVHAGIPVALQAGYESYVPKTRVVLFEAGVAAANGLSFDEALATITIDAAKILGIDGRLGSLEVGKDGDVAVYDGDPFEYTTHCTNVVINGRVVSDTPR